MKIDNVKQYNLARKQMPYAWPGGYPLFAITQDGGALCAKCFEDERREIGAAIHHKSDDGWRVVAIEINWECTDLHCDHCGCARHLDPDCCT